MTMTLSGSGTGTVGVPNIATAQASTSGTAIDFTGIPAGTKRITVMFYSVSTNSTSNVVIQIGSGSFTTTGYNGTLQKYTTTATIGNGFPVYYAPAAAELLYGSAVLYNITGNQWVYSSNIIPNGGLFCLGAGIINLAGTLDRVRVTSATPDTFDSGTINIIYE